MPGESIRSTAIEFMDSHLASAEEIALLVALMESRDRWWDPPLVSRELGIPQSVSRAMLDRFAAANLLDIRVTDDVRYQFRPGTRQLEEEAAAFAEAYRAHPTAVLRRVAHSARRSVRDFADAFRIRRHGPS